jgi:hypothetical protein
VLAIALEIAGSLTRAFTSDDDPDYRGLIARATFKEVRMRDGEIVGGTLNAPLVDFRKWRGEKPLQRLADLALFCAPEANLVDGCTPCQRGTITVSEIKDDLLHLQELLTPEEEAEIESCYHELRGQGLI